MRLFSHALIGLFHVLAPSVRHYQFLACDDFEVHGCVELTDYRPPPNTLRCLSFLFVLSCRPVALDTDDDLAMSLLISAIVKSNHFL